MSTGLFGFVFKTLRKRVNDPNNATYWLPNRLQDIDDPNGEGKLLPLKEQNWNFGNITGTAGANFQSIIKDQWWLGDVGLRHKQDPEMTKHQPIPCPNSPWPQLAMPEVTVNGLSNLWVADDPPTEQSAAGYSSVITLQFGFYDGIAGKPTLSQLQFDGSYELKQCACSASADDTAPSECDGWESTNIKGTGAYTATLTEVFIDATIDIRVAKSGTGRTLDVVVNQLVIRGATPEVLPALTVDKLTVDTEWAFMADFIWIPKAKEAIESEDGRHGLISNLNVSLNQPSRRQELAGTLTRYLNKAVDDVIGTVPSGQLPDDVGQRNDNAVDQYLFDRARYALNDANSPYYLPRLFYTITNPQLEPYKIDAIPLGNQQVPGLGITFKDFTLNNVTINGLSNAVAPANQLLFNKGTVNATLLLSSLNPPPAVSVKRNGSTRNETIPRPPLNILGRFAMRADGFDQTLDGGIKVTANGAKALITLTTAGKELDELVVTFTRFELEAASNILNISLDINSAFKEIINQMVNQDSIKVQAIQKGNEKTKASLKDISDFATTYARKMIASKLDD